MICQLHNVHGQWLDCPDLCQDVEIISQRVIIGVFDESHAGKVAEGAGCVLMVVEGASAG